MLNAPNYVRRNGVLADVEGFDAPFFGIGSRDAAIMDPQHRHFIESAWHALKASGHPPESFSGSIGVSARIGRRAQTPTCARINNTQIADCSTPS